MNKLQDKEVDIVNKAVNQIEKTTGFKSTLHFYEHPKKPDAVLGLGNDDFQIKFNVDVKIFINRARLGAILNQLKRIGELPLLITEYVNPELMETMEHNNINFIDTAGNAFIKVPPLFIKIKGNKLNQRNKIRTPRRTFNTAALRVIFTLLCNPGIENRTIRVIEDKTGVATGTVYNTMQALVEEGYMHGRNFQRYKWLNKKDLLERWVTLYPEKLKPKYIIGRYATDNDEIKNINLENFDALLGGEAAAARLTNYLQPFIYTIYINEERQGEFTLRNRLKKHPQGKLEMIKKFWKFPNNDYREITHPILIYADLLATGDPRNIETAHIIYEKYIAGYIEKD